jgi:glycerophosphoryl diester phosphodiesterase
MNNWIRPEKPLVIAHRGYSLVAPENTLMSYRKAIEVGADMLEVDINLTKDGQLVMIHDHRLERTTNGTGFVHDYTLNDLKELDAGFHFIPRTRVVRIPTTEETIQLAIDAGIKVCFEIKGGDSTRAKIIAEKLVNLFVKYNAFDWASISSYFPEASAVARKLCPELVITRERLPDNSPFELPDAIEQAKAADSPILLSDFHTVDKEAIDGLHNAGIAIWTWNPFTPEEITQVISDGTDGIMGDNPEVARKMIDSIILSNKAASSN